MQYKYIFGNKEDFEILGINIDRISRYSLDNSMGILGIEFNEKVFGNIDNKEIEIDFKNFSNEFKVMSESEAQNYLSSPETQGIWWEKEILEVEIKPEKIIKEKEKEKKKKNVIEEKIIEGQFDTGDF